MHQHGRDAHAAAPVIRRDYNQVRTLHALHTLRGAPAK